MMTKLFLVGAKLRMIVVLACFGLSLQPFCQFTLLQVNLDVSANRYEKTERYSYLGSRPARLYQNEARLNFIATHQPRKWFTFGLTVGIPIGQYSHYATDTLGITEYFNTNISDPLKFILPTDRTHSVHQGLSTGILTRLYFNAVGTFYLELGYSGVFVNENIRIKRNEISRSEVLVAGFGSNLYNAPEIDYSFSEKYFKHGMSYGIGCLFPLSKKLKFGINVNMHRTGKTATGPPDKIHFFNQLRNPNGPNTYLEPRYYEIESLLQEAKNHWRFGLSLGYFF